MIAKIDPSRLYTTLLNTGLQQKDNALYQVLRDLIRNFTELVSFVANNPSTGNTNLIGTQGQVGPVFTIEDGLDGLDGQNIPVQGPQGIQGNIGLTGAPAILFVEDGLEGDPFPPIQGPQGNPGIQGIQGLIGATSPIILFDDVIYDDQLLFSPLLSSSVAWILISTATPTSGATVDFTGLANYSEILVLVLKITLSTNAEVNIQISIDNGSTWKTTSGDYVAVTGGGFETNVTSLRLYDTGAATARTGFLKINNFNVSNAPKVCHANFFASDNIGFRYISTLSPCNALRCLTTGGTFTGGTIYLLGR